MATRRCIECKHFPENGIEDDAVNVLCDAGMLTKSGFASCCDFEPVEQTVNKCGDCVHSVIERHSCTEHPSAFVDGGSEACDSFKPKRVPMVSEETHEKVFEKAVRDYCNRAAELIISKNRKYGDSFRAVRQECKERYGDPTIPLFIHTFEKERRLKNQDNDDEDAAFDRIGYLILEEICKELDD